MNKTQLSQMEIGSIHLETGQKAIRQTLRGATVPKSTILAQYSQGTCHYPSSA